MPTYRFRKVYFICKDNSVFSEYSVVTCFRNEGHAMEQEKMWKDTAEAESKKMWNEGKIVPKLKAEAFYLVPERLFDELLKKHAKD